MYFVFTYLCYSVFINIIPEKHNIILLLKLMNNVNLNWGVFIF